MNRMDEAELARALENPAIHRQLVGDYNGAYSLGVTRGVDNALALALDLDDDKRKIPATVTINGRAVRVIVHRKFRPPVPLRVK